ncbi:MAG TPA: hypothetical protein VGL18_00130 [Actinomycetota bacterium]|jgi:hypothetical protein
MEPSEIFELIIKADEALKYATEDKVAARARQAREYLTQALQEAQAIGNQGLVEQAERRLADLDTLQTGESGST